MTGAAYTVEVVKPMGRSLVGELRLYVGKDRLGSVRAHAGQFRRDRTQLVAVITVDGTGDGVALTLKPPSSADGASGDSFRPTVFMERASRVLELASDLRLLDKSFSEVPN